MSSDFVKITAVIIVVSLLAVLLRKHLAEYSFLLVLATVCTVLVFLLGNIFPQIQKLRDLFNQSNNANVYFVTALKALGISYITDFASNICRDYGLNALAQTADMAGKSAVFVLSIPLVCSVMECVLKFVRL